MTAHPIFDLVASLTAHWWRWTTDISVQFCVVFCFAETVRRLFSRRLAPRVCHALWLAVVIKLGLPPGLASPLSLSGPFAASAAGSGSSPSGLTSTPPWQFALFVLWSVVIVTLAAVGLARHHRRRVDALASGRPPAAGELRSAAQLAQRLGLRRVPTVLISRAVRSPAVVGLLRPVVLLPEPVGVSGGRELEHVLLHEMAHIRRRDPAVSAFLLPLQLVFWFHPLMWLARRRLSDAAEMCCDEIATRHSIGHATSYSDTLRRLAGQALGPDDFCWIGMAGFASRFEERLAALDRHLDRPRAARVRPLVLLVWVVMIVVVLPSRTLDSVRAAPADSWTRSRPQGREARALVFGEAGASASSLQVRYAVLARMKTPK